MLIHDTGAAVRDRCGAADLPIPVQRGGAGHPHAADRYRLMLLLLSVQRGNRFGWLSAADAAVGAAGRSGPGP